MFSMQLPDWAEKSCVIKFSDESKVALDNGSLKFFITKQGGKALIKSLDCFVQATEGDIRIGVGNDNALIKIGKVSGRFDLRCWRNSTLSIGDGTTCNGARMICDNSSIQIGNDCLFSDEIILQSADQHGIIDLKKREIINLHEASIIVGNHVWIGRRACLLNGSNIGSGSIVGFGSLVNQQHEDNSLIVGVPGKTKKSDITWSRNPSSIDQYAKKIMSDFDHRVTNS